MATAVFIGNAIQTAQVITSQVTAVAVGGTLTATINTKAITYTCVTGDTVSTAASAFQALLAASSAGEFQLAQYTVSGDTITCTAANPGEPFSGMSGGLTFSAGGGTTQTQATVTVNSSPSDVNNAKNWNRGGTNALPQTGDNVVLQGCTVPLLWNLSALSAVLLADFKRYASQTGQVGLPPINPAGFVEFRATSLTFGSNVTTLPVVIGLQDGGDGPPFERYDFQTYRCGFSQVAGQDVTWRSTHASSTINVTGGTFNSAVLVGVTSTIASGLVDGGGTINLGVGCTFSGTLTLNNATGNFGDAPAAVVANGSQVTLTAESLTYAAVTGTNGTTITGLTNSTITALTLKTNSTYDKSQDARAQTVTGATIDGDTCQIIDPNSAITYGGGTTVNGTVSSGPFQFQGPKVVTIA